VDPKTRTHSPRGSKYNCIWAKLSRSVILVISTQQTVIYYYLMIIIIIIIIIIVVVFIRIVYGFEIVIKFNKENKCCLLI
jgi:membrane protein YdbS with pleckstrin-like domain